VRKSIFLLQSEEVLTCILSVDHGLVIEWRYKNVLGCDKLVSKMVLISANYALSFHFTSGFSMGKKGKMQKWNSYSCENPGKKWYKMRNIAHRMFLASNRGGQQGSKTSCVRTHRCDIKLSRVDKTGDSARTRGTKLIFLSVRECSQLLPQFSPKFPFSPYKVGQKFLIHASWRVRDVLTLLRFVNFVLAFH